MGEVDGALRGVGVPGAAATLYACPDVIIVFTDGETPWPAAPPPRSAVIVVLLGRLGQILRATPPWATRVECTEGG